MKNKSKFFKILFASLLVIFSLTAGYLIYLFHYYLPEPVSVELKYKVENKSVDAEVFSTSFLYKTNKINSDSSHVYSINSSLIRKLIIKVNPEQVNQLSEINLKIGNNILKLNPEDIKLKNENFELTTENTIKTSWFLNFGLINHRINFKKFCRAILDVWCLYLVIFVLIKLIKLVKSKSISKTDLLLQNSKSLIPVKHLEFYSVLFLSLPMLVFVLGFLKIQYSVVISGLILFVLYKIYLNSFKRELDIEKYSISKLLYLLIFASVVIFFSGIGGLGFQTGDWHKHNDILSDLITYKWPVIYNYAQYANTGINSSGLVYYIAFYLVPAIFGKAFGWEIANYILIIQSIIAIMLTVCWVYYFVNNKRNILIVAIVFILFSGADFIFEFFNSEKQNFLDINFVITCRIQYSSFTTLVFWVPQHAFVAWISTALTVYYFRQPENFFKILFVLSFVALWSVYIAIGLIPFVFVAFLYSYQNVFNVLRKNLLTLVASIIVVLVSGLFFISKSNTINVASFFSVLDPLPILLNFVEFTVLEWLLILFFLLKSKILVNSSFPAIFLTAILFLTIVPFVPFISYFDFVARASIPALFIFSLYTLKVLFDSYEAKKLRKILLILLLLGLYIPCLEFSKSVNYWTSNNVEIPRKLKYDTTIPLLQTSYYSKQYLGNENSFFFRYLCKSNNENSSE